MAYNEINATEVSDFKNIITDYSVDTTQTDSATGEKETTYINAKAPQQLGYYKSVPELKMAIDAKATWTMGKGIIANPQEELVIMTLKGFGKDTFNGILENLIAVLHVFKAGLM